MDVSELKAEPIDPSKAGVRSGKPRRHIMLRLFGIKLFGWVRLVLLCLLVGFFVLAAEFDPASPNVDVMSALGNFLNTAFSAAKWAIVNFWKPTLAGASIVMPIWFLWRVLSLPFRK
jgi:hypothetical protein